MSKKIRDDFSRGYDIYFVNPSSGLFQRKHGMPTHEEIDQQSHTPYKRFEWKKNHYFPIECFLNRDRYKTLIGFRLDKNRCFTFGGKHCI